MLEVVVIAILVKAKGDHIDVDNSGQSEKMEAMSSNYIQMRCVKHVMSQLTAS